MWSKAVIATSACLLAMKIFVSLIAMLFISGCVSGGYQPSYRFNQLQVVNLTGSTIERVEVRVLQSERSVRCAEVNNHAICDKRFGSRRYLQQGVELSWDHVDGNRKTEVFNPPVPVYFSAAFPLRIVMEIDADGAVKSFYEQDDRNRSLLYSLK